MRALLLMLVTLSGLAAVLVSGYYMFQDWAALNRSFAAFEGVISSGAELRAILVAQSYQNAFRINCFAEGVGVLLGATLAAIGLHGLCLLPPRRPRQ
ncbi:MAG: hypothetical protein ACE5R4_14385 [Armatimonadota bacterium]